MSDTGASQETIDVLIIPSNARITSLIRENRNLAMIALVSKKRSADDMEMIRRFKSARAYLAWLETNDPFRRVEIDQSSMKVALTYLLEQTVELPEDIREHAQILFNRFEQNEWGVNEVDDGDEGNALSEDLATSSTTVSGTPVAHIPLPPSNHPVYGQDGIMHGVVIARGVNNRIVYKINHKLRKKEARVYGHNDIPVGSWFPLQLVALFNGAHGASMGGIAGNVHSGAYSIVIAGTYDDLDRDHGDVVYYSGSNSRDNDDPTRPEASSTATQYLKASLRTGNPVRVLRSGGSTNSNSARRGHLPQAGIRYDGLYRVVDMLLPKNARGGLYEQFKLERLPDQPDLSEIRRTSPTTQQLIDLQKIQQGY